MVVTFDFDPMCPWTWMTSRWLVSAAAEEGFDVVWAPLSLAYLNRDQEVPERYRAGREVGQHAARLVSHLHDAGENDAIGRFYQAWGQRFPRRRRRAQRRLAGRCGSGRRA